MLAIGKNATRRGGFTSRKSDRRANDRDFRYRPRATYPLRYLGYAVLALGVMTAAIASHDQWFLNFVHVICGVLWTGIDLFMGL
jgi:hypothetical protein